ncbi:MAG: hypothetical protein VST68_10665, partial [Nitrospirota bacterium]|nr:hypothetical protein [Nitrospirota bacterium]
ERFSQPNNSVQGIRNPKGRARADMVFGPFAETKEPVLSRVEGTSSCGDETPRLIIQVKNWIPVFTGMTRLEISLTYYSSLTQ